MLRTLSVALYSALIAGYLFAQPRIVVDLHSIEDDLFCGEIKENVVNISNAGNEILVFDIDLQLLRGRGGWVSFEPDGGRLEPRQDMDVVVTVNTAGFNEGAYEAIMLIRSNDPILPCDTVWVTTYVIGAPALEMVWDNNLGYPDILDFNRAFDTLYTFYPYTVDVRCLNVGTADLIIEAVTFNNQVFSCRFNDGPLRPGDEGQISITLEAQEDGLHRAIMTIISNDASNEELRFALGAETEPPPQYILELTSGWNMVSAPVIPFRASADYLFRQIRSEVMLIKDVSGRFWTPVAPWQFYWDYRQGYLVKMHSPQRLTIVGEVVAADTHIPLRANWNIVAYFPEEPIEARIAFRSIDDILIIAKDNQGRFYYPARNFNNLPLLQRGNGYLLKVRQAGELVWNIDE